MKRPKLIVDGYNVIHRLEKYRRLQKKEVELAVNQLINDLSRLRASTDCRVTVVFDGKGESVEMKAGVEVIYSAKGKTADTVIERLSRSEKGRLMVVTADYQQQKVVFRKDVSRITPHELSMLIEEADEEIRSDRPVSDRTFLEDRLPRDIRDKLDRWRKE
ncbi:MAG TPA: hypothetical protein ENH19_00995 [Actinobacteria bacterium]|nr:hypothetical protein [Actinomycetes bacterium]HEX21214.1 hypothetical protein [Actinomycetota bacterium]